MSIKVANQGVRQIAKVKVPTNGSVLLPGTVIINMRYTNKPQEEKIPEGYIGIVHKDKPKANEISIVRDDCKAAHKAIRAEELNKLKEMKS